MYAIAIEAYGSSGNTVAMLMDNQLPIYSEGCILFNDGSSWVVSTCNATIMFRIYGEENDAVGGNAYPANKVGLVAPWLALAGVIAAGGVYMVRRRVHS